MRLLGSSTNAIGFSNIFPTNSNPQSFNSSSSVILSRVKPCQLAIPAYQLNQLYAELLTSKVKQALEVVTEVMIVQSQEKHPHLQLSQNLEQFKSASRIWNIKITNLL